MDRYDFSVTEPTFIGDDGLVRTKCDDGDFVYYDDAQAEIARLTAELENIREDYAESLGRAEMLTFKLVDTEVERDQALSRAAAAAMETRERAATHTQWTAWGERHVLTEAARKAIRALPIDPDAQKALDQLLAKAREDAIREAAEQCEKERWNTSLLMSNPPQSDAARMIGLHILALLNDGDRE